MTRDWYPEERSHKRVTLCNVGKGLDLKNFDVRTRLLGMGACEWETYMESLLAEAINNAHEHGENMADVTKMFSCDLVGIDGIGDYRKNQESVEAFLMEKLFDVVSETDEELKVTLKHG